MTRRAAPARAKRAPVASALWLALPYLALTACGALSKLSEVGRPPEMSKITDPTRDPQWRPITMPMPAPQPIPISANSLWRPGARAFLKDQRASQVGDIVTILVNITDSADVKDASNRATTGSENLGVPNIFGLQSQIPKLFGGALASSLLGLSSSSGNTGAGEVNRTEAVTLRLAGTVTQVLPNGNLAVSARQEMRVNSELRELQVSGIARPQDIASDNTIQHDRLAEARIAYGGRGQITDIQTPRWGQQVLDILLPF